TASRGGFDGRFGGTPWSRSAVLGGSLMRALRPASKAREIRSAESYGVRRRIGRSMNHPFVATRSVAAALPHGALPEEAAPSLRTEWLLLTAISVVAISFRLHGLATRSWD